MHQFVQMLGPDAHVQFNVKVPDRDTGALRQSIAVVPDSGTDELVGLAGSMTIDIVEGKHFYNFEYWFEVVPQL